jgi:hypothetical protein
LLELNQSLKDKDFKAESVIEGFSARNTNDITFSVMDYNEETEDRIKVNRGNSSFLKMPSNRYSMVPTTLYQSRPFTQ